MEIFLVILGIAILLLVIFCIPVLVNLWRTTKDIAVTLETLNRNLPEILKNLEDITNNINNSTFALNREVQVFSGVLGRFNLTVKTVVDEVEQIAPAVMKTPVFQTIRNIFAIAKGINVFLNVLLTKEDKLADKG